ncbi:MAG: protease modulator HflC [Alphaproteobacteria bacterium]
MRWLGGVMVVLLVLLVVANSSLFVVSQIDQALVLRLGKPVRVHQEPGLKVKMPFVESVEFYDKRLLDFDAESKEIIAADQKRLIVDAFVRYRITNPLRFKQTVGNEDTMRSRLNVILESSLRQVIGTMALADAISGKRTAIMHEARDLVNAQAQGAQLDENGELNFDRKDRGFGIEVLDVRIVRADLPQKNSDSIYERMQTSFEREAKEFRARGAEDAQKIRSQADKERTILLADAGRKAEILRGEGDSTATKIFAQSFGKDEEFFQFYRSLQAYQKTLDGGDTTMILSPDSEFLRYLEKSDFTR